ncbi:OLC1v1005450C1 [Oldenlandia corymbosa var. corymbosa]|uniref:OLC1v1005450C1 n=1 Tax=Oldenlandia corymbosa var. corymbosa TaxID=529605 RepID=A0AAV1DH11_OLDCO|nr:OLC1v1005450C1 [Oldenlandia corymbosa var. corymbosa]
MASMTMTASLFLGGSAGVISKQLPTTTAPGRRGALVVKASRVSEGEKMVVNNKEENGGAGNGRRDLVFAVAAAAACGLAKAAMADVVEPKRGTTEAKKKYAPVCVTMPTAKICHK